MNYIRLIINMVALGGVFLLLAKFSRYWRRINPPNPNLYEKKEEFIEIPGLEPEPETDKTKTVNLWNQQLYTCPCCGYKTLTGAPGSYEICHVCFWEDDDTQLLNPWYYGGANEITLVDAQQNYKKHKACDKDSKKFVAGILPSDVKDPEWRPAKEADKINLKNPYAMKGTTDYRDWYYWLKDEKYMTSFKK